MRPKLIILPGWSGTELLWRHQIDHLADVVDPEVVVLIDQDTVEKMADELLSRAPERFILCGHSLGGWVAQEVAIKAPTRVMKLILLGTWTGASSAENTALYRRTLRVAESGGIHELLKEVRPLCVHPDRKDDAGLMELMRRGQETFPNKGLINQTKAELNSHPTTAFLHKISCPTLVIYGRQDAIFDLDMQKEIAENIPNAQLVIVEDCGHMLSIERPQAITALIRLWVQVEPGKEKGVRNLFL